MREYLPSITENLLKQKALHTELLRLLEKEHAIEAAFNGSQLDQLEEIQADKNRLVKELEFLDDRRLEIVSEIQSHRNLTEQPNLKYIAAELSEDEARKLLNIREELLDIVREISDLATAIAAKAEARGRSFRQTKDRLKDLITRNTTYAGTGKIENKSDTSNFRRII